MALDQRVCLWSSLVCVLHLWLLAMTPMSACFILVPVHISAGYSAAPAVRALHDCHVKEFPTLSNQVVHTSAKGRNHASPRHWCRNLFCTAIARVPIFRHSKGGCRRARRRKCCPGQCKVSCDRHTNLAWPWCAPGLRNKPFLGP